MKQSGLLCQCHFVWFAFCSNLFFDYFWYNYINKEKIDPITNKPLEKSTFDNILNYVKYFSIIVFLGSLGFNGYMYFIVYLPQYYKWFKMLPDAAKAELITINTLNSVIEHARQNPTHGTLGLGNGLINIRL